MPGSIMCPQCWTYYKLGTTVCKRCKVRLTPNHVTAIAIATAAERPPTPASIRAVRWALVVQSITGAVFLGIGLTSYERAISIYGSIQGQQLYSTGLRLSAASIGIVAMLTVVGVATLAGLALQLWIAKWFAGRVALGFVVGAGIFLSLVLGADRAALNNSAGLAVSGLAAATLCYSIARPPA